MATCYGVMLTTSWCTPNVKPDGDTLADESISRKDPHKGPIIVFALNRCIIQGSVWGQPVTIPARRERLMGTVNALGLLFLDPGGPQFGPGRPKL